MFRGCTVAVRWLFSGASVLVQYFLWLYCECSMPVQWLCAGSVVIQGFSVVIQWMFRGCSVVVETLNLIRV